MKTGGGSNVIDMKGCINVTNECIWEVECNCGSVNVINVALVGELVKIYLWVNEWLDECDMVEIEWSFSVVLYLVLWTSEVSVKQGYWVDRVGGNRMDIKSLMI